MAQLRKAIGDGRPGAEVREGVAALDALFADTEHALAPSEAGAASAFVGALTILVREGLEALLIVVAMLTFLRKAERPEMVRTVHYGWVAALIAGLGTWWAATNLLTILAGFPVARFRFSALLPIAKFFAYSSALIAVLAVVLAGKGLAALQEAGLLGVTPLAGAPRVEILGLYPTLEGLGAQAVTLVILLLGFAWNRR